MYSYDIAGMGGALRGGRHYDASAGNLHFLMSQNEVEGRRDHRHLCPVALLGVRLGAVGVDLGGGGEGGVGDGAAEEEFLGGDCDDALLPDLFAADFALVRGGGDVGDTPHGIDDGLVPLVLRMAGWCSWKGAQRDGGWGGGG